MEITESIQSRMLWSVKPTRQLPKPLRITRHSSEVKFAHLSLCNGLSGLELVNLEETEPIIRLEFTLANEDGHLHFASGMGAGGRSNHRGLDGYDLERVGKTTHGVHERTAIAIPVTATIITTTTTITAIAIATSCATHITATVTATTATAVETMGQWSTVGKVCSTRVGVGGWLADGWVGRCCNGRSGIGVGRAEYGVALLGGR